MIGGGWAALFLSVLGIIGGALAMAKPKLAGWLMLLAAIGGFISVFLAYIVAGPLLLIGELLALLTKGSRTPVQTTQTAPPPPSAPPAAAD